MLDRTIQPLICEPEQLAVPSPECRVMKNGIPLYILNAGDNEVVRIDLLIEGGRWQQNQRLQALFTNRMLREGTRRYSAAAIAEKIGLLWCLVGAFQLVRVCLYHPLFFE